MSDAKAITKDSFKITGRGIVLELQHSENGLSKETKLVSQKSGRTWKVITRVLFDHALAEQKIFNNESTNYMLMRFNSDYEKQKSINRIKKKETENIFQYFVNPIGHSEKPENGEILKINYL
ncbi:hypothetical protein [uncultured Psychroserpens sp.]|uniref:hypothetical protein n=1 Tax=uncultured Psychroserpens sp. TaxID=255436 RepID=UPI0026264E57|nr:hypothetical protein [uncultured Psychroserpens sp.]